MSNFSRRSGNRYHQTISHSKKTNKNPKNLRKQVSSSGKQKPFQNEKMSPHVSED